MIIKFFINFLLILIFGLPAAAQNSVSSASKIQIPDSNNVSTIQSPPVNNSLIIWGYESLLKETPTADVIFNSTITTQTRTLPRRKFGYQSPLLTNTASTHFLLNNISYGLIEGFEIGMSPLLYAVPDSFFNFEAKWNFLRTKNWDVSLGYATLMMKKTIDLLNFSSLNSMNGGIYNINYTFGSLALLTTFRPESFPRLQFNFTGKRDCFTAEGKDMVGNLEPISIFKCSHDFSMDTQYRLAQSYWLTLGLGSIQRDAFNFYNNKQLTTLGIALSHFKSKRFFSRPSIGMLYTPENRRSVLLFSTTINEI